MSTRLDFGLLATDTRSMQTFAMAHWGPHPDDDIRQALLEVEALMMRAFEAVHDAPEPGCALNQAGLRDGRSIVEDFLNDGERVIALEHLIYMIREPASPISWATFTLIERTAWALGLSPETWEDIRPESDA